MSIPKDTQVYVAYVAGVFSAVALGWVLWKSQLPPVE